MTYAPPCTWPALKATSPLFACCWSTAPLSTYKTDLGTLLSWTQCGSSEPSPSEHLTGHRDSDVAQCWHSVGSSVCVMCLGASLLRHFEIIELLVQTGAHLRAATSNSYIASTICRYVLSCSLCQVSATMYIRSGVMWCRCSVVWCQCGVVWCRCGVTCGGVSGTILSACPQGCCSG